MARDPRIVRRCMRKSVRMGRRRRSVLWAGLAALWLALGTAGCGEQAAHRAPPPLRRRRSRGPSRPPHDRGERRPPDPLAASGSAHSRSPAERLRLRADAALRPACTSRDADLAICHVETPMTSAPPTGYPVFNTPPALARAIRRTGWDVCDTASNHSLDQGRRDRRHRARALARAGIAPHRLVREPAGARRTLILLREGRARRVPGLHRDDERDPAAAPVVGEPRARRPHPRRRPARPPPRRAGGDRQPALGRGVRAPDRVPARARARLTRSKAITAIVGQHVHVVQPIRASAASSSSARATCCPTRRRVLRGGRAGRAARAAAPRRDAAVARGLRASATCRRGCATPTTPCCRSATRCAVTSPTRRSCARRGSAPSGWRGAGAASRRCPRVFRDLRGSAALSGVHAGRRASSLGGCRPAGCRGLISTSTTSKKVVALASSSFVVKPRLGGIIIWRRPPVPHAGDALPPSRRSRRLLFDLRFERSSSVPRFFDRSAGHPVRGYEFEDASVTGLDRPALTLSDVLDDQVVDPGTGVWARVPRLRFPRDVVQDPRDRRRRARGGLAVAGTCR